MENKEIILYGEKMKDKNDIQTVLTKIKDPSGALWGDQSLKQIWIEVESSLRNPILLGIEETKKLLDDHLDIVCEYPRGTYSELELVKYLWGMPVTAFYQNKQFCGFKIDFTEAYKDWKGNLEWELADLAGRGWKKEIRFKDILNYIRSRGE
ncbi:MAG: hypothetical protein AABX99_01315 [Nanoarchaeota archaeon]